MGDVQLYGFLFMLAMFLAEISLLFAARFAPQMNVFVLAMPAKSGIGYLFLCLLFGILYATAETTMWRHIDMMGNILRAFE